LTSEREYYLLERCMRLEARIAELQGRSTESPPPPPPLMADLPIFALARSPSLTWPHRIQHRATPDDIAQMRELKTRGLSNPQVGRRTGFSECTVRRYTRDTTDGVFS